MQGRDAESDKESGKVSIQAIHDMVVNHFRMELEWKDTLESKGVSLLGFVGVFLAVLISLASLAPPQNRETLKLLAAPVALQVVSAILLFAVVSGYATLVGPSLLAAFEARAKGARVFALSATTSYGTAVLANRILLTRSVVLFRLSVLFVAVSLVQLGLAVGIASADVDRLGPFWTWEWIAWVPAGLLAMAGSIIMTRDYRRLSSDLTEELRGWVEMTEGASQDGTE